MGSDEFGPDEDDSGESEIPGEDEIMAEVEGIQLSPAQHQRIKDLVNGEKMARIEGHNRRYLVAGAGGETGAATRRDTVYQLLDNREDPSAIAMKLEEFGLTPDEIELWTRVFDILCGRATHIVGVLEDFDGGYVWELGLMFSSLYREKVWVLKRRYLDPGVEREKYANGMAASHVRALLTGDRGHEWTDADDLREAVEEIP